MNDASSGEAAQFAPAQPAAGTSLIAAPTRTLRGAWLSGGGLCLLLGTVGIVVPLLPTVDFYVLAAWCFARGSRRWEQWLLSHPRIGPLVKHWRAERSVPLKAKWLATLSMALSCLLAWQVLPLRTAWIPALLCLLVAAYLWTRPTRRAKPKPHAAPSDPLAQGSP